ncbi:MAG: leucyl aminopeptidase [Alphaproteobacteria bacterium]
MDITFHELSLPTAGTLALTAAEGVVLGASGQQIDRRSGGSLGRAMSAAGFKGKKDEVRDILAPAGGKLDRVLLAGLGKAEKLDGMAAENLGGSIYAALAKGADEAAVAVDPVDGSPLRASEIAAHVAMGARLRSYRFDKYRTKEKKEDKPRLKRLKILVSDPSAAKRAYLSLAAIADGIVLARDLVSEPPNILYPDALARHAKLLSKMGVDVEIFDELRMAKLGMGALLGVGQGSVHQPRLVVMQWRGSKKRDGQPIAFVGKGVTFDTGGISIKPANNMWDMKWDMAGAGTVIGLMRALAGRKARANVVGVCALVENMPSGTAQRPGDIVKSMSGQTIEVLNTDAEGRLILADALWYAQDRFKPRFMVNLATLTGAVIVALGHTHAGLFSNNDELSDRLIASGKATGELLWRLPLSEAYDKLIDSDVADVKNIGDGSAGSITGAQFIQRFVNDVPWAHLDIAGTAWSKKDVPTVPKGATAFGVRMLDRLVADHYEDT